MRISGRRGKRGAKKLDMSAMRAALTDGKVWSGLGIVVAGMDDGTHFELDLEIGVLVTVELMPHGQPITARLGGLGAGAGSGVWRIPPIGTEVALLICDGDVADGDALIVGTLSTGAAPGELDGDTLVIKAPAVMVIADSIKLQAEGGTPQALMTQADFDAHKTWTDTHTHPTGVGPSGPPTAPSPTPVYTTIVEGQ